MEFEINNQLVPRPSVGRRRQALVQRRGAGQACTALLDWAFQGQGAGAATMPWWGKSADAGFAQWCLRPMVANGASAGQPAPSPVRVMHRGG